MSQRDEPAPASYDTTRRKAASLNLSLHPVDGELPEGVEFSVHGGNTLVVSQGAQPQVTIIRRQLTPSLEETRARIRSVLLDAEWATRENLDSWTTDGMRNVLISHMETRCTAGQRNIQCLTSLQLCSSVRMYLWLRDSRQRPPAELAACSLDEQRNLAISIIGPLTDRGRELQDLTNAELMRIIYQEELGSLAGQ